MNIRDFILICAAAFLIVISLCGCGTDGVAFHDQDFGGVTSTVTSATETVKKAQAVAQDVYDNGATAKSPELLQLKTDLTTTQDSLTQALQDVATLQAGDVQKTDEANKVEAEEQSLKKAAATKQAHWTVFWIVSAILIAAAAIAAPLIVAATGAAGLISAIPIIGSIVGTGERIAISFAAGVVLFGLMELGKLFGLL